MVDRLSSAKRSALMSRVKARNTKPEMLVRSALHRAGYRYGLHVAALPGKPDIVLKRYRTVVFVHGCFWHGHECRKGTLPTTNVEFWKSKIEGNRTRDERNVRQLEQMDWQVFVIWECELHAGIERVLRLLSTEKASIRM